MKTILSLLLSCFLLAACSNKPSETNSSADSVAAESSDKPMSTSMPSGNEGDFLTIHGKDIWVRDAPGTGKVVMKLNEGDRCKLVGAEKRYEIIRGQADWWYPIEFNGQEGWIFGSQTSKKNKEKPREFSTLNDVVNEFAEDTEKLPDSVERYGDNYKVVSAGTFEENGFAMVSFQYLQPGMRSENFSWVGFRENNIWKMFKFSGEAVKLFHKKDQLFTLLFIDATGGAFTSVNDYVLFSVDAVKRNFLWQQNIFEFDGFDEKTKTYSSGEATIKFLDDTNDKIQIDLIDNRYAEEKKVLHEYKYQFDKTIMLYVEK